MPGRHEVAPAGLDEIVWTGAGSSWSEHAPPVVHVPKRPAEGWRAGLTLPVYALDTTVAPPQADSGRIGARRGERAPVLPSLFMPGFPKSATTWLYKCMMHTFSPLAVGCGVDPAGWSAARCGRRFLLPSLSTNARGETREQKETFFFGGTLANYYSHDLLDFHGPDPRGQERNLSALWLWESMKTRLARTKRELRHERGRRRSKAAADVKDAVERAAHELQSARLRAMCANWTVEQPAHRRRGRTAAPRCARGGTSTMPKELGGVIPGVGSVGCTHPGCVHVARSLPKSWSGPCMWTTYLHEVCRRDLPRDLPPRSPRSPAEIAPARGADTWTARLVLPPIYRAMGVAQ